LRGKKPRRLQVGDAAYLWSVKHAHRLERIQSGSVQEWADYKDCCEQLTLRRAGAKGRLVISFLAGPGRVVSDGYGPRGLIGIQERGWLNLHEPGTVRVLLDAALEHGWQPDEPSARQIDGWLFFDTVVAARLLKIHRAAPAT
jgi:hypothetical protein